MEQAQITIACQGAITVGLDELCDLQGELKDLTEENYVKLRNSILKFGFSFPVFLWIDPTSQKKYILDAHQRVRVLTKMKEEGYTIPPLPADIIAATDIIQAKEKLLVLNSQYGKTTQEGFDAFIADIPMDDVIDVLVIPDVMLEKETGTPEPAKDEKPITCPSCGYAFKPGEKNDIVA